MRQLIEVARTLDWRPLWISLKTGVLATAVCFVLGILAAWRVMYCRGKRRSILDAVLTLPMILPPTVAGFFLLLFFSRRRPLGIFLFDHFGIKIVQSQAGCVIAAAVIGGLLVFVFLRTVLGPRIADRVVAVNLTGTLVTLLICVLAYLMAEDYLVDISLIYTTLSFLAVVLLTKIYMGVYRQKRHQEKTGGEDAHDA